MNKEFKNIPQTILMVEPIAFHFNKQTAENNFFQQEVDASNKIVQEKALAEFKAMVKLLRNNGINVITVKDSLEPHTPDSIFPNNWFSTHDDGNVVLYPMFAPNRQAERREEVFTTLEDNGFKIEAFMDYTGAEEHDMFLEGTGSMILDRENKIAYAAVSDRTNEDLFIEFCEDFEYDPIVFDATQEVDGARHPIYHTNVMMCLASKFSVVCLDSIQDKKQKKFLTETLKNSGKEIISITVEQMHNFAGNMLQVRNEANDLFLVMSNTAKNSLREDQITEIERFGKILSPDIDSIETIGGGSVRCMMAEIYLPKS